MKYTLSIFLFFSNILINLSKTQELINSEVSLRVTPEWLGTFHTTTGCDKRTCCCISGLITLSKMKPNYLRIVSQVDGYNCPTNTKIDSIVTMPTGFKTELALMGGLVDISLSKDSRVITLYNQNAPSCSGEAERNNGNSIILVNHIKMLFIVFLIHCLIINSLF